MKGITHFEFEELSDEDLSQYGKTDSISVDRAIRST